MDSHADNDVEKIEEAFRRCSRQSGCIGHDDSKMGANSYRRTPCRPQNRLHSGRRGNDSIVSLGCMCGRYNIDYTDNQILQGYLTGNGTVRRQR